MKGFLVGVFGTFAVIYLSAAMEVCMKLKAENEELREQLENK